MRPPKTPFWQTITLSPGSTRLTKHASMPAEPGAETGIVSSLFVLNRFFSIPFVSSIMRMNSGSKCPIVGRAMADRTRGLTSDGPGPISVRTGGWKEDVMLRPLILWNQL